MFFISLIVILLTNNVLYMSNFFGIGTVKWMTRTRGVVGVLDILYGIVTIAGLTKYNYTNHVISGAVFTAFIMVISFVALNGVNHIITFINCERTYRLVNDIKVVFNYEDDDDNDKEE